MSLCRWRGRGAERRGEGGKAAAALQNFMNGAVVLAFWRVSGVAQGGSKPEGRPSRHSSIKLAGGAEGEGRKISVYDIFQNL